MLLKANAFPRNRPVWDGKPVVEKLWTEWKRFFNPLCLALERNTAASSDHPGMLGTAAASQRYHGILPDFGHRYHSQGGNTQGLTVILTTSWRISPTATWHLTSSPPPPQNNARVSRPP